MRSIPDFSCFWVKERRRRLLTACVLGSPVSIVFKQPRGILLVVESVPGEGPERVERYTDEHSAKAQGYNKDKLFKG